MPALDRDATVQSFLPLIWKEALSLCRAAKRGRLDRHDPAELVQEGLAKVLGVFGKFRPELGYRPATYFVPVARRAMWESLARRGVIRVPQTLATERNRELARKAAAVGHALPQLQAPDEGRNRELAELHDRLGELPPLDRLLVVGWHAGPGGRKALARSLGMTYHVAERQVQRVLAELREKMS